MSETILKENIQVKAEPGNFEKSSLSFAFQQSQSKDTVSKEVKKKKVTWNMKKQLHLHLQLNPNQEIDNKNTYLIQTPIFSPLRIKRLNTRNSGFGSSISNSVSLSSKNSKFQIIPTMSMTSSFSPLVISPIPAVARNRKADYSKVIHKKEQKNSRNNCFKNDYSNNYIHSGKLPFKYIRNAKEQVEGYPKLQKLYKLKKQQIAKYATRPYGARVKTEDMAKTLNSWVYNNDLQFDVIMIGALTENQLIYPLLTKLPIDKLCSKPGFLFIWASTQKISELSTLMNDSNTWSKKFRRSEELVFIPIDKNSVYYPKESSIPEEQLFEEIQWHCWMCITGTVRRSSDKDLIHCNVNTDLALENSTTGNSAVPSQIYKVVENFSSSTRRLHIIPTSTGLKKNVNVRPGWVIISPDVILDNFEPDRYKKDLEIIGTKIPYNEEIEQLRPKTPV